MKTDSPVTSERFSARRFESREDAENFVLDLVDAGPITAVDNGVFRFEVVYPLT